MGIAVFPEPVAAGGLKEYVQEFNSTTNWAAPNNTNAVRIFIVGGGGGGGGKAGGLNSAPMSGGGGGGGAVIRKELSVTPGTTYTVTIGAGGAGAVGSGSTGGASSFGNLLTANGGGGGGAVATSNTMNNPNVGATMGGFARSVNYIGSTGNRASGGGGAGGIFQVESSAMYQNSGNYDIGNLTVPTQGGGAQYLPSWNNTYVTNDHYQAGGWGGPGVEQYGWGGSGGNGTNVLGRLISGFGAGIGQSNLAGGTVVAAVAATANQGGGGGGGGMDQNSNTNNNSGSSGGSGYCRIVYLA